MRYVNGTLVPDSTPPAPDAPTIKPEALGQLGMSGVLTEGQANELADLGLCDNNVLANHLDVLVAAASKVDVAAPTSEDMVLLAGISAVVPILKAELGSRGSAVERQASNAAMLLTALVADATTARKSAARLPRISQLARTAPGRVRPVTATAGRPMVLTAAGEPSTADLVATFGTALRRSWEGARKGPSKGSGRILLASLQPSYPEARRLTDDVETNHRLIEAVTSPAALQASGGICSPVPADYTVNQVSDAARPVKGAMVQFMANHGGVRYTLPHTLAAVTADGPSVVWTAANDANPTNPTTKPHATFLCQPPLETLVDAVTSITRFGNFQARFFPEQIAAYLETVLAVHARLAEGNLLAQLSAGSTQVFAGSYELGAARDLLAFIDRAAAAAMRYRHRMAPESPLRLVIPEWLEDMLRADLVRQLPGDSGTGLERLATADAEIAGWFAVRNINVTDTADSPLGANPLQGFGVQGPGQLSPWPARISCWLYPEGSWMFADGGEMNLGMVYDSTLNRTNDCEMFSESFEKAIFRGVESIQLNLSLAPTGASASTVATYSGGVETVGS
ncbi:MAG: major capsid protein [Actinomycetota bacterium]|nr:major capsid protein [Actinomycetota bacterium]